MSSDPRKQSLYLPCDMLDEIGREAVRLDRSISWLVQKAWALARERMWAMPGANDGIPGDRR